MEEGGKEKGEAKREDREDGCCLSADRLQLRIELYQDSPSPQQQNSYTCDPWGESVDAMDLFKAQFDRQSVNYILDGNPGTIVGLIWRFAVFTS